MCPPIIDLVNTIDKCSLLSLQNVLKINFNLLSDLYYDTFETDFVAIENQAAVDSAAVILALCFD